MARGFVYLAAVMDWFARCILAWRLSNTMEASFCIDAVEAALTQYGSPQIFNTDQGSQFTSAEFTSLLISNGLEISMDGKGAWRDNVFVERFWRTINTRRSICTPTTVLPKPGNRSVVTLPSTTRDGLTPRLTSTHPIRLTSNRCPSARQPNPGRRST
jgi:transposase InsO family protein